MRRSVVRLPTGKAGAALVMVLIAVVACSSPPGPRPRATAATARPATSAAMPRPAQPPAPVNVYAHIRPGMINPKWRGDPVRVYVPDSLSNTVTVINPQTYKVIGKFPVGAQPNHVTPSWDGSVLFVNDTAGNSLVPVNPATGRPGAPVPVADPYNLYFTPDGRDALVMAEAFNRIDFRDPHTMRLRFSMRVPCAGVNHMDFTADGRFAVASCEFSAQLLYINMRTHTVAASISMNARPAAAEPKIAVPTMTIMSPIGAPEAAASRPSSCSIPTGCPTSAITSTPIRGIAVPSPATKRRT